MSSRKLTVALAAIALAAPSAASAHMFDIDENGNTTLHQNDFPKPEGSDGGGSSDGTTGILIGTDVGSTIPGGSSSCTYRVEGQLVVRNPTVDGIANDAPVAGVDVKVSGRTSIGWYNEWDTVTTNSNGEFTVTKTECGNRSVKVQARFESDDLRVTSSQSKDWYQLHETAGTVSPSTIDLNQEPFGGETGDQSSTQARTDAQTWIVYQTAMDYVDDIGHPMLQNQVTVHNPATLTSGPSAADPILHDIHIDPTDTSNIDAMLHEFMHIWAYTRVTGEGCLTWDAIISGDTHDRFEAPCVAFLEAEAQSFSEKLKQELVAAGDITPSEPDTTPWNRAKLEQTWGVTELRFSFPTSQHAWEQVFRVLTSDDITSHLFGWNTGVPGFATDYVNPACSGNGQPVNQDDLADVMRVIGDANNQMDVGDVSVEEVMDRAEDRLSTFDATDNLIYTDAVDPQLTSEPHHGYGC